MARYPTGFNTKNMTQHTQKLLRICRDGAPPTRQQDAILELVLLGMDNNQIAMRLRTTRQVVNNEVHFLLARHNVRNRTHLAIQILTKRHQEELRNANEQLVNCTCSYPKPILSILDPSRT